VSYSLRHEQDLVELAEELARRYEAAMPRAIVGPDTGPAENVVGGWAGVPVPDPPRERSRSRANFRKTERRRPSVVDDEARRLEEAWWR
jgi:hypothetical protein